MKPGPAAFALLILLARPAATHRVDEYLQASLITLAPDRVQIQLDLTTGVAVFPVVLGAIDINHDGTISEGEWSAYAAQVLRDLSLDIDGDPVRLRLVSSQFPEIRQMREGLGVIRLEIAGDLRSSRSGPNHRLSFENHHQSRIAAYLVNSVVPQDPELRITSQSRDSLQSVYRVEYTQDGARRVSISLLERIGIPVWMWAAILFLLVRWVVLWRRRTGRV